MADGFIKIYEVPEFLNVDFFNKIRNNALIVRTLMYTKGYNVAPFPGGSWTARTNIGIAEVKRYINYIEICLDMLNDALESQYYVQSKTYEKYAPNKEDIWRWIQVLNDLYSQVAEDEENVYILKTTDGYPTIDGKRISVLPPE
jgi:hypothetical protein